MGKTCSIYGKEEKLTKFQSENPEKRPHGETQVEMEEYIKLYLKETGQEITSWTELTWHIERCTDLANVCTESLVCR